MKINQKSTKTHSLETQTSNQCSKQQHLKQIVLPRNQTSQASYNFNPIKQTLQQCLSQHPHPQGSGIFPSKEAQKLHLKRLHHLKILFQALVSKMK
jgi:hypothetical protein